MSATVLAPGERDRRRAAVQHARASIRLEGGAVSVEIEVISDRYIAGDITTEEFVTEGLRSEK